MLSKNQLIEVGKGYSEILRLLTSTILKLCPWNYLKERVVDHETTTFTRSCQILLCKTISIIFNCGRCSWSKSWNIKVKLSIMKSHLLREDTTIDVFSIATILVTKNRCTYKHFPYLCLAKHVNNRKKLNYSVIISKNNSPLLKLIELLENYCWYTFSEMKRDLVCILEIIQFALRIWYFWRKPSHYQMKSCVSFKKCIVRYMLSIFRCQ